MKPDQMLEYKEVEISDLVFNDRNPRINDEAAEKLTKGIERYGFINPVVVNRQGNMILAGHTRIKALKQLGEETVPALFVDMDEATARGFAIWDNRSGEFAAWDQELLESEIKELVELDFDIGLTGFDLEDFGLEDIEEESGGITDDDIPEMPEEPVTQHGDLWILNNQHRIYCGDCTDKESVLLLMDKEKAQMSVTSPPYAMQRAEEYGGTPAENYPEWFGRVAKNVYNILDDTGSFFVNIKEHVEDGQRSLYVFKTIISMTESGWRYIDQFVWAKVGIPGGWNNRLRNDFEPVHFFCKGDNVDWYIPVVDFNIESAMGKKDKSDLEKIVGSENAHEDIFHFSKQKKFIFQPKKVGTFSKDILIYAKNNKKKGDSGNISVGGKIRSGIARPGNVIKIAPNQESLNHPAVFPVKLPEFFIKLTSGEGDIVYEPFLGSGSTLIAAEKTNRRCYGLELEPAYCTVILNRWRDYTGKEPVLERTNQTLSEVENEKVGVL